MTDGSAGFVAQNAKWLAAGGIGVAAIVAAAVLLGGQETTDAPAKPAPQAQTVEADAATTPASAEPVRPSFDTLRISPDGLGVVAGRMSPGARVELLANGEKIAEEIADGRGEWVIILNDALPPGPTEFDLRGYPEGGGDPVSAEKTAFATVPERGNKDVLTILADKKGEEATRVLQAPAADSLVGSAGLSIQTIDYDPSGRAIVTGRAKDSGTVRLYLDNEFVGRGNPGADGQWEIRFTGSFTSGDHVLRADQVIGEGEVQLRIEQPFTIGEPVDLASAKAGVVIRPGNTLWQVARLIYGKGPQYTVIFRENSEQIRDPNLIYPGQTFALPSEKDGADDE